jgi:glycosyltransferase involved in cell wall biosynthesis
MAKKILWLGNLSWDVPNPVGCHHLARCFEEMGYEILFINIPVSLLSLLFFCKNIAFYKRLKYWWRARKINKITIYTPFAFFYYSARPLLNTAFVLKNWPRFTLPNLKNKIKKLGFAEVDAIVIDQPVFSSLIGSVSAKVVIHRIVDWLTAFPGFSPAFLEQERKLAEKVNCVIYTSKNMEQYISKWDTKRAVYLSNGVDFAHFTQQCEVPVEYSSLHGPIAVYVGGLGYRFDHNLLAQAAKRLPEVNFILIGPEDNLATAIFSGIDNIHLLGSIDYQKIPAYLQHATVGIMPFNVNEHLGRLNGSNPLKMYQYFASSISCLSVYCENLANMNAPIAFYKDVNEFVAYFKNQQYLHYDAKSGLDFVRSLDWWIIAEKIEQIMLAEINKTESRIESGAGAVT